jgi:endonuclease/exonuclease/phosphatase (EEP) superfamily protein YafD
MRIVHPHTIPKLLVLLLYAAGILGCFAAHSYVCTLFVSFKHFYFVSALVLLIGFGLARKPTWIGASLILVLWNAAYVIPWYVPAKTTSKENRPTYTIISANLLNDNENTAAFIDYILEADPDLLLTQETRRMWTAALTKDLQARYPHSRIRSGFGIFSKTPIQNVSYSDVGVRIRPVVQFDTTINGQQVHIMGIHVHAPRKKSWANRNTELIGAAELASKMPQPCIVLGDLNATLWDPAYKNFARKTELTNTRRGFGLKLSHCKWGKYIPLKKIIPYLSVPIDHVLVSEEFSVTEMEIGPHFDSDHLPVKVALQL